MCYGCLLQVTLSVVNVCYKRSYVLWLIVMNKCMLCGSYVFWIPSPNGVMCCGCLLQARSYVYG
jgi:hypothetical protein